MRALTVTALGTQPTLIETDLPAPAPGELQIAVRACGLNFADLLMIEGKYQATPPVPFALGLEMAGDVVIAPAGSRFAPGDRVAVVAGHGGLAERANVPEAAVLRLPDAMSYEHASAFQIAYGTSHLALRHRAALQPGETLVVLGAAGGVGLTAVEIGKRMGARVIACARGPEKLAIAKAAGADEVLEVERDDLRAALKALGGADVIYDAIGGDAGTQAARALKIGGRYLVIGFAAGGHPEIPLNHALVKNITIHGIYWGGYTTLAPEVLTGSMAELFEMYAQGGLHPHISASLPLERSLEALDLLRARKSTGKVVVTI